MSTVHFETRLTEARETGQPWHVIGNLVRDWLEAEPGDALRKASRVTAMSQVMLRRYLVALDRIADIERSSLEPPGSLLSGAFGPTELALRLATRNPMLGLDALKALKQRSMTLRDLRKQLERTEYAAVGASRGRALRDRGSLLRNCEALIAWKIRDLFGQGTSLVKRPPARYLRRTGFEFHDQSRNVLGGADLYLAESGGRDPLEQLAQSVLLASYLPVFYVVLGPDLGHQEAERSLAALDALDAHSVGALLLHANSSVYVARAPKISPRPIHTDRYVELLKRFAVGRGPLRGTE